MRVSYMLLGYLLSSVIVRLDHPEIADDIKFPLVMLLCLSVLILTAEFPKPIAKFLDKLKGIG